MVATTAEILALLGQRAPRRPLEAEHKAEGLVRSGLPISVVGRLADTYAVSKSTIEHLLGVPATTRARRQKADKPLKPSDSDRAFRLARTFATAEHVLEDRAKARRWFVEPNHALDGERPLDILDTEAGTERVLRLLYQIEYGTYS